jgi:hypothetical protein
VPTIHSQRLCDKHSHYRRNIKDMFGEFSELHGLCWQRLGKWADFVAQSLPRKIPFLDGEYPNIRETLKDGPCPTLSM